MSRKIMFAVCCYSGKLDHTLVMSLFGSVGECKKLGWETRLVIRAGDSLVTRARNVLATTFLESGFSDMIMVDDDVAWQEGALPRMIAHPVEVVAGAYPARGDNVDPPFVMRPIQTPGCEIFFDKDIGLIEVEGVGGGFLRVTRTAIERLAEARKDRWYEDTTAPGMKIIDFFDFDMRPETHQYFSEDYTFCRRFREIGGKVWVDPELTLFHSGPKAFVGCLGDWLRKNAVKKPVDPIAAAVDGAEPPPVRAGWMPEVKRPRAGEKIEVRGPSGNLVTLAEPAWAPDRPLGGTEIMVEGLRERLGSELGRVDLWINGPSVDYPNPHPRVVVAWMHCDIDQPAAQWIYQRPDLAAMVSAFVFVSEWQRDRYLKAFQVPAYKCRVLRNATEVDLSPLPPRDGKIKLAYTSTPFRGLDVLLKAWQIAKPDNAELHIWSSMALYGPKAALDDARYATLYDFARSLPNVTYHGIAPNAEVRAALRGMDIWAYPSTFAETSCLAAIEAMAAGCWLVCPDFGALRETTGGLNTTVYGPIEDRGQHAIFFADCLRREIAGAGRRRHLHPLRSEIHRRYDWSHRIPEWRALINEVCAERTTAEAAE